jgi:hypothetical protein
MTLAIDTAEPSFSKVLNVALPFPPKKVFLSEALNNKNAWRNIIVLK